jgi:hypothetical protein
VYRKEPSERRPPTLEQEEYPYANEKTGNVREHRGKGNGNEEGEKKRNTKKTLIL